MTRFTEHLWSDLAREHGPALAHAARPEQDRVRRPGVIAGSTLALAGAGTALALGLTATGSTPAFAVTKNSDGSVLVQINQYSSISDANAKLTAMGIHEQFYVFMGSGAAAVSGPVACVPGPGEPDLSGPPVKVLLGTNGTQVIPSGTTPGNTGAGTWHITHCYLTRDPGTGGRGNTGAG